MILETADCPRDQTFVDNLKSCIPVHVAPNVSDTTLPAKQCNGGVISSADDLEKYMFCEIVNGSLEILNIDSISIDLRSALAYVTVINGKCLHASIARN